MQSTIKRLRFTLKTQSLSTTTIKRYQELIESAKQKILELPQLEDDWTTIEYSEAKYIPTNNRYNNPTSIL